MNRYSRRCHVHGGAGRKLLRERFGRAACGALSGIPTAREVALHLASIARHPPDRKHGGCARKPKIPPRRRRAFARRGASATRAGAQHVLRQDVDASRRLRLYFRSIPFKAACQG